MLNALIARLIEQVSTVELSRKMNKLYGNQNSIKIMHNIGLLASN